MSNKKAILVMVHDGNGCRLVHSQSGAETILRRFSGRVQMKHESPKAARGMGLQLFCQKKTGKLVEVEL